MNIFIEYDRRRFDRRFLNQVMESTKYKLLRTLGNSGIKRQSEVAETCSNTEDPFAAMDIEYLLTSYVQKKFDYVEFTAVPIGNLLCRKNRGSSRIFVDKEECSSTYQF